MFVPMPTQNTATLQLRLTRYAMQAFPILRLSSNSAAKSLQSSSHDRSIPNLARIDASPVLAVFLAILWLFMFPGAAVIHPKGKQVDLAYAESATPKPSALR